MRASVSLVLREADRDLSLLMIRRAVADGDRWSGQIAFPGGRTSEGDANSRATAERETVEELGLDLSSAQQLARLDDLTGTSESLRVSAYAYGIEGDPVLRPNDEVHEAFWVPFVNLTDPKYHARRNFDYQGTELPLPALRVLEEEHAPVLWGLSYRFLELLMAPLGRPIPGMPWDTSL